MDSFHIVNLPTPSTFAYFLPLLFLTLLLLLLPNLFSTQGQESSARGEGKEEEESRMEMEMGSGEARDPAAERGGGRKMDDWTSREGQRGVKARGGGEKYLTK